MEVVRGGFCSSALSTGEGDSRGRAIGIYLTDKRLIVTEERLLDHHFMAGGGRPDFDFGTSHFLRNDRLTVEKLDAAEKKLDVPVQEILRVEIRPPGFVFGGRVEVKLKSGRSFKIFIADRTHEHSKLSFLTAADLLEEYLPTSVTRRELMNS